MRRPRIVDKQLEVCAFYFRLYAKSHKGVRVGENFDNKMKCKLFFFMTTALLLSSCGTVHYRFLQGDVIGFSDKVETSYDAPRGFFSELKPQLRPRDLLNASDKASMRQELTTIIPRGENTAAYYAMELATERIKYVRRKYAKNDPQTKYYIFLLTDGLDNASPEVAKQEKKILFSRTPEQYQKRLQKKLKGAMGLFAKNTFEVYPMMFEGEAMQSSKQRNKMSDAQFKQKVAEDMKCFRYSSVGEAPELISADNFRTIIEELRKKFISSTYTFRIPKSYVNKNIRMNFENRHGKKISLTGKLQKKGFSYVFSNIQFDDPSTTYYLKSRFCTEQGKSLIAHANPEGADPLNVYFTIEDIRIGNSPYFPVGEKVEQEYETSNDFWQLNSEYREVTKGAINTYFLLVVDGSRSLDGKNNQQNGFKQETDMAKEILDMLTEKRH